MTGAVFRTATLDEVARMLEWAAEEGWNPGLDDAKAFYAADPSGFFVADLNGQTVAAISVVNHSDDFAFLGLYLCVPEWRGRGIGFGLWRHAIAHAGTRTIGLDGVSAQEANYAKSGFILAGRTRRMTGVLPLEKPMFPEAVPEDFDDLATLDRFANGVARDRFMQAWLQGGPNRKTVVLHRNEKVQGFATVRRCRDGAKVGPIVAPDADSALQLLRQATSTLGETVVIVDVPDASTGFATHLSELDFSEGFTTARMYRGPRPTQGSGLHAVATLELG